HLDDHAFAPAPVVLAVDAHQDDVAVEHRPHLTSMQIDVVLAFISDQKAITIPMPLNPATNEVHLADHPVGAAAVADQLAVPRHGDQTAAQGFAGDIIEEL